MTQLCKLYAICHLNSLAYLQKGNPTNLACPSESIILRPLRLKSIRTHPKKLPRKIHLDVESLVEMDLFS